MKYNINIIGAGIAGLAVGIRLASRGHRVTLFEQSGRPGGKVGSLSWQGYRWDTGPSQLLLPDQIEELFMMAGEETKRTIRYRKLEVNSRCFFEDGVIFDAYGDPERLAREMHLATGEPVERVRQHLERSRKIYEWSSDFFIFQDFMHRGTFLSGKLINALLQSGKLDTFSTMHEINARHFSSGHLVQLFDQYATLNGSDPFRAPGTINAMAHLAHVHGNYFPEKGIYSLVNGLKELADKIGVVTHFNQPVEKVVMDRHEVRGVVTRSGLFSSDVVISDMDVYFLYRNLLEEIPFPVKEFKKERSSSAIIFYWAMDGTFPRLQLHNLFFSGNYRDEFRVMSRKKEIYNDPTVHLYISSKYVEGDAPAGKENWRVMINVPENLGQDWDMLVEKARENIIKKLNRILRENLETHIQKEFVTDPRTLEERTFSHRGAIFGNSFNGRTAAFERHPNFLRKYKGLYFVGGSVHPGGTIPFCLASARIVDQHIGQ